MSTWEERMSERSKDRDNKRQALADKEYLTEYEAKKARYVDEYAATLTIEQAVAILSPQDWACACMGGPQCCIIKGRAAEKFLVEAGYCTKDFEPMPCMTCGAGL